MTTKISVLIDGGFFVKRFQNKHKRLPSHKDVIDEVNNVITLVKQKTNGDTHDILFRIYYYDCRPFGGIVKNHDQTKDIDFSKHPTFNYKNQFLKNLCREDKVALRIGELSFDGWKQDLHTVGKWKPDLKQKGVDMKVGLDMAWMASNKIVDKIVLIAGDSDFVAPIKFVRKSGILVYLQPLGYRSLKEALIEHCDFILR